MSGANRAVQEERTHTDRRLHVRVLNTDQLRFVTAGPIAAGLCGQLPEDSPDARCRFGRPQDMETGRCPEFGVCAALDVHLPEDLWGARSLPGL
jgi:hypothetical protein